MTNSNDQKIDLTPSQQNPYLARPEDFEVTTAKEAANQARPGHGQTGDSNREYAKLLNNPRRAENRTKPMGKGLKLPTVSR